MKELESIFMVIGLVVVAEVVNEVVGYRLVDVKVDKNTIRRSK